MRTLILILLFAFQSISGQYTINAGPGSGKYTTSTQVQAVADSIPNLSVSEKRVFDEVIQYWVGTGVWAILDGVWILGDGEYINWRDPTSNQSALTDTVHVIKWNGLKSNESSGYINLNYNPSSDGVHFTQNDASFGYYILHGYRSGSSWPVGGNDGSNYLTAVPSVSSLHLRYNGNSGQYVNYNHSKEVYGLWAFNRTSSTNCELYIQGTKIDDITVATSGVPDIDMYALAYNDNGSPAYYSKAALGMVFFGGKMTASQVNSLKVGYERIQEYQRRIPQGGDIDIIEAHEGHIPYLCSAYRWGNEVFEVWMKSTSRGDSTRPAMIRKIHDRGTISDSYQVGSSIAEAIDEHIVPHLTMDDEGYIYVSKEYGPAHISPIRVWKSNQPASVNSGFTQINHSLGDYSYPQMLRAGSDIIMFSRLNPYNVMVWNKGPVDDSLIVVDTLNRHSAGRNYPYAIKNVAEDTAWITLQIWDTDSASFEKIFVLKTGDGQTWYNVDNSFSKDITTGFITEAELDANFLMDSAVGLDRTIFCSGAFIEDGYPKLLIESGEPATINTVPGWRITDSLITYHYDNGWQKTTVRSDLALYSRHDSYMHNASYLTYNTDEYIIFSTQNADSTVLEKWTSSDFSTWVKDSDWKDGTGLKFAWPSNDVQNTETVGKNILSTGRFNPSTTNNIDDFVIKNLKRF